MTKQKSKAGDIVEEASIDVDAIFATKQVETQKILAEVFIGYYWVDLDGLPDGFVWQKVNDRPLEEISLSSLLLNFKTYGVLHCDSSTALPAGLKRSWIATNPSRDIDGLKIEELPELKLTLEGEAALKLKKIMVYGGNHRRHAQKMYLGELRTKLGNWERDLKTLKNRRAGDNEEAIKKTAALIVVVKEIIIKLRKWGIAVFDIGGLPNDILSMSLAI